MYIHPHTQVPYNYTITTTPSPLHHHHCTITTAPSPLHHHHYTITTAPSPLHHHHYTSTTTPSPLHHHHYTSTTTPSPLHHHHYTSTTTPSRQGALVTPQPSYIRANDVIYGIFLTHAQTVDTRLSFSTRPRIRAWGRGYITPCIEFSREAN